MELSVLINYSYVYEVYQLAKTAITSPNVLAQPMHTINIRLIGSRLSAKTIQMLKWLIELGYQNDINVKTDIWRLEVSGAKETYEELMGVAEDIYEITCNTKNSNSTNRELRLPNNTIKVNGLLSNRKNKTPKLGKARKGIKKDLQINVFEEATEFADEKQIQIIQQATGGAKFIINIYIANPWVSSNWYVKIFSRLLPFNEKLLRTRGEQIGYKYVESEQTLNISQITNHRINTFLSDAQHQMLYDAWKISEQFARVVDLGMPGVAEGLIYAPIVDRILPTVRTMPVEKFKGGIDWGTSSYANGSATSMVLGRVGRNYSQLCLDDGYYHSNAKDFYKSDDQLIAELVEKILIYTKENRDAIKASYTGRIEIAYDYAAATLGKALKDELNKYKGERLIVDLIYIVPCVKFEVPTRIDIVKLLISQGRYKVNRDNLEFHFNELENAQWEETKLVSNRPTRLNENDHSLDAMEYMIGSDLLNFASNEYLTTNKVLKTNYSQGSTR